MRRKDRGAEKHSPALEQQRHIRGHIERRRGPAACRNAERPATCLLNGPHAGLDRFPRRRPVLCPLPRAQLADVQLDVPSRRRGLPVGTLRRR